MRALIRLTCFASLLLCPMSSYCSVVPDPVPCVMSLETNFFDPAIVSQALSNYLIPQGVWSPITQRLQDKSQNVPERMKQATANMVRNPIEYPMDKPATAKILKQVLFQVFLETLREYQVNERPTADYMFEYIFAQQMPRLVNCFGEEVKKLQSNFQ